MNSHFSVGLILVLCSMAPTFDRSLNITGNSIERNCIYQKDGKFYRVLSIFKKSYNKWRHERKANTTDKMKVHLQVVEDYYFGYHAHENCYYTCEDSCNLGIYLGHVLSIDK